MLKKLLKNKMSRRSFITRLNSEGLQVRRNNCSYCERQIPQGQGVRGDGSSVFCSYEHYREYLVGSGPEIMVHDFPVKKRYVFRSNSVILF
jgi:hypothetical protein